MNDHASKKKGLIWVLLACVIALLFIVGIAPLAHLIPWSTEEKMAAMFNSTIPPEQEIKDANTRATLAKMIQRIYPVKAEDRDFSVDVHIVKSPIVNAYTELGGRIILNTGLINQAKSPEEIEAVLAHEMEHVRHRHIMQGLLSSILSFELTHMISAGADSGISRITHMMFNMKFTRAEETEADRGALTRLQKAHVDNHGFKDFFQRMENDAGTNIEFLSDHPSNDKRIKMVEEYKNKEVKPVLTAQEWDTFKKNISR